MSIQLREMRPADWPAVERIYLAGISGGNATFAETVPTREGFFESHIAKLCTVAIDDQENVCGWVAATPTSAREVYRGVIEHSVYVDPLYSGRGIGVQLLNQLAINARELGYWTIQGSIFPENHASLALHDRAGFRRIGTRERIALMSHGPFAGRWRDTILVELRF